jgi:hypothetical protein
MALKMAGVALRGSGVVAALEHLQASARPLERPAA